MSDDQQHPVVSATVQSEGAAGAEKAILEVRAAMARHAVTRNPVFIWEAVEHAMAPDVGDHSIPLSPDMRRYLHAVAASVRTGALGRRKNFHPSILRAMGLGGNQGASVAKRYAMLQSAGPFLGLYETLKKRHGSEKALEMLSRRMRASEKRVAARVTELRKHLATSLEKLGICKVDPENLGYPFSDDIPDAVLLSMAQGRPDLLWREGKKEQVSEARPKA